MNMFSPRGAIIGSRMYAQELHKPQRGDMLEDELVGNDAYIAPLGLVELFVHGLCYRYAAPLGPGTLSSR